MNKKANYDEFNRFVEINLALAACIVNSSFITMFRVYMRERYSLSKTNAVFPPTKVSKPDYLERLIYFHISRNSILERARNRAKRFYASFTLFRA